MFELSNATKKNDDRLTIYYDRVLLSSLDNQIKEYLIAHNLVTQNSLRVSFCGLIVAFGKTHLFLPRNTITASKNGHEFEEGRALIKALRRFFVDAKKVFGREFEDESNVGETNLKLIFNLIEDFFSYGLYKKAESFNIKNRGKPDWRKTISSSVGYANNGKNSLVYLDIVGRLNRDLLNNEISKIHARVIDRVIDDFGWLFYDIQGSQNLISSLPQSTTIEAQIRILTKELSITYVDRDVRLLKMLIEFLKFELKDQNGGLILGTKNFHYAWEVMLRNVLSYTFSGNHLFPVPTYQTMNLDYEDAPRKSQRLDILLKHPNKELFCIIDAKYYAGNSIKSSPGWGDLVKQFFYAKALKEIKPNSRIKNIFIFPGDPQIGYLKKVDMRNRSTGEIMSDEYPHIDCYYIPPMQVLDFYSNYRKMQALSEFFLR